MKVTILHRILHLEGSKLPLFIFLPSLPPCELYIYIPGTRYASVLVSRLDIFHVVFDPLSSNDTS